MFIGFFCIIGILLATIIIFRTEIDDIRQDVTNLYESRDHLWKEFFKLQQTCKLRDKELLNRIHTLECRLKRSEYTEAKLYSTWLQNEFTRGKNEALQTNQKEETGTYSEYSSKRIADIW